MTQPAPSTVIPGMRYRRAPEAIDWLCSVLGFERNAVYPGPDNTVAHAQLTFGTGMIVAVTVNKNKRLVSTASPHPWGWEA